MGAMVSGAGGIGHAAPHVDDDESLTPAAQVSNKIAVAAYLTVRSQRYVGFH